MNIKKILCGVLAGLLLCMGTPGNVLEAQGKSTVSNLFSNGTETKPELNSQPVVTFRYSNGKIYKRYTVSNGKLKLPSMANKKGCTFMGWSKVKGRTANPAYESGDTITVKSNMNLCSRIQAQCRAESFRKKHSDAAKVFQGDLCGRFQNLCHGKGGQ